MPRKHFDEAVSAKHAREVDFYLVDGRGKPQRCEVKLMGKGNPESADAVMARDSKVFIADKLSDLNKRELDKQSVLWIELRDSKDFKQFEQVLQKLLIPYRPFKGKLSKALDKILERIFADNDSSAMRGTVHESRTEYLVDWVDDDE